MDRTIISKSFLLLLCLIQTIRTLDLDGTKKIDYPVHNNIDTVTSIDPKIDQDSIESEIFAKKSDEPNCKIIHLAVVCGGFKASREFYVLIKSILFHRSTKIHLHLLVDNISHMILDNLFKTWQVADLFLHYYNATELESEISWIPSRHYSHRYGLMKLPFLSLLYERTRLSRIIIMDTDMLVLGDIKELQSSLDDIVDKCEVDSTCAGLGLVENQSDWYLNSDKPNRNVWPAIGRGYNSGLILANLLELDRLNWPQIWRKVAELQLITQYTAPLADQDIFNAIARESSGLVKGLPSHYNIQLNDHSSSEGIDMSPLHLRVIHWNSPHKLKTKNILADYFNDWYLTFQDWSGRLLKQSPCTVQTIQKKFPPPTISNRSIDLDSSCLEIRPQFSEHLRTYLYSGDYELNVSDDEIGITVAVHLSVDRFQVLDELASHWRGQISAAIYLSEQDTSLLVASIESSKSLSYRRNIGYHLVFRDFGFSYPINRLRNIALSNVNTPYVFLSDIDLIPSNNLYDYLQIILLGMPGGKNGTALNGKVLVVPVFENLLYKFDFPNSKSELLTGMNMGSISMFRDQIWPQGQAPTDYVRWRVATRPYEVEWRLEYEPFIVAGRDVPRFDERFVGFGWNKVEHTMLLSAMDYKFIVLPEAFVMHKFHSPSYDIIRHRESARYRRCIMQLKKSFLIDLHEKYPAFFAKLGNKMQL